MKLRALFITILFITLLSEGYSQKGAVFVEHYGNPIANLTTQNKAIVQTLQGDMFIANAQGVVHYDGHQWQRIDTKATVSDLLIDSATVFTAGRMSFGYLQRNAKGQFVYTKLDTTHKGLPKKLGNFRLIGKTPQHIYFLSPQLLVQVDKKQLKVTQFWQSQPAHPYTGLVTFKNQVFVNIGGQGLAKLDKKQLVPTAKGSKGAKFKDLTITSTFSTKYLPFFTANDNFVYRYDGTLWQKVKLEDQKYLHEHTLTTGAVIGEKYLALGTLDAGVLVVALNTGKTLFTINDQTGLPDDEVLAVGVDKQLGLWIAHSLGISRAALNLRVKGFGHYPGLVGNMTAVTHWQDKVYVATNEGLFYLHKTETYAELIKHISNQKIEKKPPVVTKIVTEVGGGTVVGNLINKAFGRKKKKKVTYRKVPQRQVTTTTQNTKELLQKQLYNLRSFPYFYQKVNGFDGKVTQLLALPNQLFIASNKGLYVYQNKVVQLVLPQAYIYQIKQDKDKVLVATNAGVISLKNNGGSWTVHERFEQIKLPIYSVVKINNELWLGSENKVVRVQLTNDERHKSHQVFELPQYYLENVQVAGLQNKPVLFLSDGVYRFKASKKQFERDQLLKMLTLPYQTIQHQDKHVWTNFRGDWVDMQSLKTTRYLSLFNKISDIYQDKKGNLWVIHKGGLHKVGANSYSRKGKKLNVLISRVFDHQNNHLPLNKIKLHQGTKAYGLNLYLKVPYYLNEASIEYQYRMKGSKKGWSKWQKSPLFTFNMLPRGKHTIELRARNSLGEESAIKEVKVKIIPPFWKTWWFYLIEIVVLLSLVFASAASSRFQKLERYSYILTFVTIITVFEFIVLSLEPSVDEFSGGVPVFKLFMNIILAISLNPIERKLAMWLSKSKLKRYE